MAIANGESVKLCDLTQFYSPLSGGVKRYVHEKIAYIQSGRTDEHVLVVPGSKTECVTSERSRIYFIHSPLISRRSHYRALINLRAIEQILERERPDLIESGDPYQVAWKAIASGEALRIPVVGFYHSHFPEAYVRSAAKFLGQTAGEAMMDFTRRYVRHLYNSFQATLVPSARLGDVLTKWGVENVRAVNLGVNTAVFSPSPDDTAATRAGLRWSAFAAAIWTALFCTIRNRGRRRRRPNPWPSPSKPPARVTCHDWGRAPRGWLRNAFPGPGYSNVYFTFTGKFALTIGNNAKWTTRRSTQFAVIKRAIALLSVNFAARPVFWVTRLIRYSRIANCSLIF